MRHLAGLRMGYAVLYSSGTRTNTHYNLQLGGETAIMVKDRFVSACAERVRSASGLGRRDPAVRLRPEPRRPARRRVPQYSYPDMVTQTIHVGDCELLEALARLEGAREPALDVADVGRPVARRGLNVATMPNPYAAVMPYMPVPGSTECINGWRGLSPLALSRTGTRPARFRARRLQPGRLRPGRVDALGRPREHLRHGRDGLRPLTVGQRRRPVRPPALRAARSRRSSSST